MKNEMDRIQFVLITLSDGRVGTFSGPEFVKDVDAKSTVTKIEFIESEPLPADMHFGPLKESQLAEIPVNNPGK